MKDTMDAVHLNGLRENAKLEAKRATGGLPESLWETYSSFANTYGGTIALGVEELPGGRFKPVGVPDAPGYVRRIWSILNDPSRISKNLLKSSDIRIEQEDGKALVLIRVPRARREDRPIYVDGDVFEGTYRRNGDGDYHCSAEEVRLMLRDAGTQSLDAAVLDQLELDVFCAGTVSLYREMLAGTRSAFPGIEGPDGSFLFALKAAGKKRADGALHPTVAGLLMFGTREAIIGECPHFLLEYREEASGFHLSSDDPGWSGNIFDFYSMVASRLGEGPDHLGKMSTGIRLAVRESLVNALVHANYYERKGVEIIKGRDFYSFSNPGLLRIPLELAVKGGLSDPRNSTLFSMFRLLGLGEGSGTGLAGICSVWKMMGWKAPDIRESLRPERTSLILALTP